MLAEPLRMNPPPDLIDDLRLLDPPTPWQVNFWLLAALGLAAALAWWLFRRWRAQRAAQAAALVVGQAHENALAELARLFALIETEQSRPYGIESSAIIRRYIEARFGLAAPLLATEEFLVAAQDSPRMSPDAQVLLGDFLQWCDLLKFARTLADRAELEQLHAAAVKFVEQSAVPQREVAAL